MVRCPQCSHHFTVDGPTEVTVSRAPSASPALKTGLIAFGLVATLTLVAAGAVVVAVLSHNETPRQPVPATEPERSAVDGRIAALQKRLDEQEQEFNRSRRRLELTIRDLEDRARAAEHRPTPPIQSPAPAVTAPVPEPKAAVDDAGKKKRADYEAHMDAGRAAMVAQRYTDALREYTAALTLVPGDGEAIRGQRDAENRLEGRAGARNQADAAAALLNKARTAYRAKRFDEALSAANQVLRQDPDNPDAKQIQRDAQQAKRTARSDTTQLLSLADAALAGGRFEDASRLYDRVLQMSPDDEAAQRGKRAADQASQDAQTALAGYYRLMAVGTLAMQNLQYGSAAQAFAAALNQVPGDLAANRGLADAQAALTGAAFGQAKFYNSLQNGYAALQAQRPADAITAFQAALRISPDNPLAVTGLRQARAMKK
jgi:tetratricopeptide (TPR) repeat protein